MWIQRWELIVVLIFGLLCLVASSEPESCYQIRDHSEVLGLGVLDTMKIYLNLLCDLFFTGVFDLKILLVCVTQGLYVLMWIIKPFNGRDEILIKFRNIWVFLFVLIGRQWLKVPFLILLPWRYLRTLCTGLTGIHTPFWLATSTLARVCVKSILTSSLPWIYMPSANRGSQMVSDLDF